MTYCPILMRTWLLLFFSILFVRFQSFMFKIKQLYKNDHLILNRRWDFLDIYKCIIHFHTFLGENSYSSRPRTFTDNLLSLLTDCPAKAIENKLFKCTRTEYKCIYFKTLTAPHTSSIRIH